MWMRIGSNKCDLEKMFYDFTLLDFWAGMKFDHLVCAYGMNPTWGTDPKQYHKVIINLYLWIKHPGGIDKTVREVVFFDGREIKGMIPCSLQH
jgi:hypothetical protein